MSTAIVSRSTTFVKSGAGQNWPISFDTEIVNDNGMHSQTTNPSRITIPTDARYEMAYVVPAGSPSPFGSLILLKNGAALGQKFVLSGSAPTAAHLVDPAVAGDYYEVALYIPGLGPYTVAAGLRFSVAPIP
jgi:hypothetical protein